MKKLLSALILSLLFFRVSAQNNLKGNSPVFFALSLERAIGKDHLVNNVGLHFGFYVAGGVSFSYAFRFGHSFVSTGYYVNHSAGILASDNLWTYDSSDTFKGFKNGLALFTAFIPQSVNIPMGKNIDWYLSPLGADCVRDSFPAKASFGTGVRYYYWFPDGQTAIAADIGLRATYDSSEFFTTYGLRVTHSILGE